MLLTPNWYANNKVGTEIVKYRKFDQNTTLSLLKRWYSPTPSSYLSRREARSSIVHYNLNSFTANGSILDSFWDSDVITSAITPT